MLGRWTRRNDLDNHTISGIAPVAQFGRDADAVVADADFDGIAEISRPFV